MQKASHRAKSPAKKATPKRKPSPRKHASHEGKKSPSALEGEGSYSAGRRYDEHVREFVATGAVEPAAIEAERALDSDEGKSLLEAEAEGKRSRDPGQENES